MRIAAHGLAFNVPAGWDARIRLANPDTSADLSSAQPVLHAADFSLPERRGDFGSGVVDIMGPNHTFIALLEYNPANTTTALFASAGPPRQISPNAFSPQQLQRSMTGQGGFQRFFSHQGRAFCLYVVLGSMAKRAQLVPKVNGALAAIEIGAS